jgi:hypothetical protein
MNAPVKLTLKLPVHLQALGNEVRRLQDLFARGLISQEEADERLADWWSGPRPAQADRRLPDT